MRTRTRSLQFQFDEGARPRADCDFRDNDHQRVAEWTPQLKDIGFLQKDGWYEEYVNERPFNRIPP